MVRRSRRCVGDLRRVRAGGRGRRAGQLTWTKGQPHIPVVVAPRTRPFPASGRRPGVSGTIDVGPTFSKTPPRASLLPVLSFDATSRNPRRHAQYLVRPGRAPGRLPGQGGPGDGHRAAAPAQLGDPRRREAVGHRDRGRRGRRLPQVATAKVERTSQRGNGDRAQGRERKAERGGDFTDAPPF